MKGCRVVWRRARSAEGWRRGRRGARTPQSNGRKGVIAAEGNLLFLRYVQAEKLLSRSLHNEPQEFLCAFTTLPPLFARCEAITSTAINDVY